MVACIIRITPSLALSRHFLDWCIHLIKTAFKSMILVVRHRDRCVSKTLYEDNLALFLSVLIIRAALLIERHPFQCFNTKQKWSQSSMRNIKYSKLNMAKQWSHSGGVSL